MITEKFQNNRRVFRCEICDYTSVRKSQYERHCKTDKHMKRVMVTDDKDLVPELFSCECGKDYKYKSGYCRHKKICKFISSEKDESEAIVVINDTNVLKLLQETMTQNKALQEQMIAMQMEHESAIVKQNKVLNDIIPKLSDTNKTTNINSNNNIINVQMFLNDKCADAMSIQNFANQLLITMDDLTKSKKDCISNVVLKNLKPLALTERPFHCTDINNKSWFVKDETEGWEEDDGEKLIKNTEYGIQKKWCDEFVKRYPQWMNDDAAKDRYIKIAGSTTTTLDERTKLKLLRELATETTLNTGELTA